MVWRLPAIVFFSIATLTPAYVDIGKREYQYPWFSLPASLAGIYGVMSLAFLIKKVTAFKNTLMLCGESSLFILIFHWFIQFKIYDLSRSLLGESTVIVSSIIAFISGAVIPLSIRFVVQKSPLLSILYFPIMGKSMSIQLFKNPLKPTKRTSD